MKIAFFLGQFPALSETFILNQITGMIDRGHEVEIIALSPGPDKTHHPEVDAYRLLDRTTYLPLMPQKLSTRALTATGQVFLNFWRHPRVILRSLNFFREGRSATTLRLLYPTLGLAGKPRVYDIIQVHFGVRGVQATFLREIGLLDGKMITAFHGQEILVPYGKGGDVYDRLWATGDLFLPISEVVKQLLIDAGAPEEKIRIHHMGIGIDKNIERSSETDESAPVRLLIVCRLVEKKGVEYILRAIANLPDSTPATHFDVVGDGPLLDPLRKLAEELGVASRVTFQGPKSADDVKRFLLKSDIFIGPSVTAPDGDTEGIPVSLMEAMAAQLPVISTYHTGIPELIQDGVSGFLVPERDVGELVEALSRLIGDREMRLRMGKAGRKFVDQEFNIDRLNDRLEAIYMETVRIDARKGVPGNFTE